MKLIEIGKKSQEKAQSKDDSQESCILTGVFHNLVRVVVCIGKSILPVGLRPLFGILAQLSQLSVASFLLLFVGSGFGEIEAADSFLANDLRVVRCFGACDGVQRHLVKRQRVNHCTVSFSNNLCLVSKFLML